MAAKKKKKSTTKRIRNCTAKAIFLEGGAKLQPGQYAEVPQAIAEMLKTKGLVTDATD